MGTGIEQKFQTLFTNHFVCDDITQLNDFLAIITDVCPGDRVDDKSYLYAKETIVIDHHQLAIEDNDKQLAIYSTEVSSTCELLGSGLLEFKKIYHFSLNIIKFLFVGIVTDTGRFLHTSTTTETYRLVYEFKKMGFDEQNVYDILYVNPLNQIRFIAHIQQNFQITKKSIAYYIMNAEDMKKFHITYDVAKNFVFAMGGIRECPI